MKIIIISFLVILNSFFSQYYAQNISLEDKNWILSNLSSTEFGYTAIKGVIKYRILDAEDSILQYIWNQDRLTQTTFVEALRVINSGYAHEYAISLLDTILQNPTGKSPFTFTALNRVYITSTLFKLGDYSTAQFVFDLIDLDRPENITYSAIKLLPEIIVNIPDFRENAKQELIYGIFNANDSRDRLYSLKCFFEIYNDEAKPYMIEMFVSDSSVENRGTVLLNYLYKYNDLNNLYRERLLVEEDPNLRLEIIKEILWQYPTPSNYKYIQQYFPLESDSLVNSVGNFYFRLLELPLPDSSSSADILLGQLVNLIDSTYNYSWLGDITFSNELKNILTTARTDLQNGDSLACRVQVKAFQDLVDNVYKDSLNADPRFVTIEGWKFLYWNAQYVLDRLPEPPANPNLVVSLKNSLGTQIPASNVKYYEGSWKDAVNNGDGTFTVITTRPTVSIRVYYEYASLQADNVNAQNNTYTFTTVNAAVKLKNSLGNLIDAGTIQYYAGAWRSFGTTSNGVANKELLPINYSFRMTYEYGSIDKQQNLSTDPTVVFQTVNAAVQLKNSLGSFIDVGTVQYYAGAWRSLGTTSNGVANKELLPINYSFRMTYESGSIDKQQNLSSDPTVVFQTVNAAVQLKNSLGNFIDVGTVQYYAGAWRSFGTTLKGVANKELLPINYSFRMTYEYVSKDKQQNLSTNPVVDFNTVLCSVKVSKTSDNQPINNAAVKYYSGAWRNLGTTNVDGITTKELLPANLSFRATFGTVSLDKQQDISVNSLVEILLNIP